jgi:hypothetical protein
MEQAHVLSEKRLRKLLDDVGRVYDDDDPSDVDWPPSNRWPYTTIVPAEGRARRTVYITKVHGLLGVETQRFPDDVTLLYRYGVTSQVDRIARECPSKRLEFIGDLDPLDLTVYLALASRLSRKGVIVEHVGVGDRWLERCLKYRPGDLVFAKIPMGRAERAHVELLQQLPIDWDGIVGKRAMTILKSGSKVELEGATNPDIYGAALTRDLERELFHSRPRRAKKRRS